MTCTWSSAKRRPVGALWAALLLLAGCGLVPAAPEQGASVPDPTGPVLYTAAGSVRTLLTGRDGRLWAATAGGGVLCWDGNVHPPRRWTTADGLASNDVFSVARDGDGVQTITAAGRQRITGAGTVSSDGEDTQTTQDAKRAEGAPDTLGTPTGRATNRQGAFLATSFGLWRQVGTRWRALALPAGSPASHVSALATSGASDLMAGLYGDGVYRRSADGHWTRLPGQPDACRYPTALVACDYGLDVGTQDGAVWRIDAQGRWQMMPPSPTLPAMDINSLVGFRGALWASTFDGGLLRVADGDGRVFTCEDGLSSLSPRDLTVFQGTLYARHADGALDCSVNGVSWHPAFSRAQMPRPQVYALAAGKRLLLGGWAGWSATDGQRWEWHFHDLELAGQVVTAIVEQGDAVWIGTQKRGLLRFQDGRYTRFQEPQGLTDDWITCLAAHGDHLLVGTYVGGVLERQGERFFPVLTPGGFAVRALTFDPQTGNALAATPLGLYREEQPGRWARMDASRTGGAEAQAVLASAGGTWCATRTSLSFVPRDTFSR